MIDRRQTLLKNYLSIDFILSVLTLGIVRFVFVEQGTNRIITRFGKYEKTLEPGLQTFISLWGLMGSIHGFEVTDHETNRKLHTWEVDIKELVYTTDMEKVISKDNVQFEVSATVYFKIENPEKAIFSVSDYVSSLRTLIQSVLRAEIGKHDLERTYSQRSEISQALAEEANSATRNWGITVIRLEIKEFDLKDFATELLKQKQQEIKRKQQVTEAEGMREAKIKEAEGTKAAAIKIAESKKIVAQADADAQLILSEMDARTMILTAEAAAKSHILQAEAESTSQDMQTDVDMYNFNKVSELIKRNPYIIHYLRLNSAEKVSENLADGKATKLFLPNSANDLMTTFLVNSEAMSGKEAKIEKASPPSSS
ncbi:MAG: stomatin-like protein [Mariprofundaceae bacterium]|nr:stomatin-like protein [Mariprofundaceae bacterium]